MKKSLNPLLWFNWNFCRNQNLLKKTTLDSEESAHIVTLFAFGKFLTQVKKTTVISYQACIVRELSPLSFLIASIQNIFICSFNELKFYSSINHAKGLTFVFLMKPNIATKKNEKGKTNVHTSVQKLNVGIKENLIPRPQVCK